MRLDWHAGGGYEEIGGVEVLQAVIQDSLSVLPREHLRQLSAVIIRDEDPRGKSLGIWRQDHTGVAIELYLRPHVEPLLALSPAVRDFALRLHLAYTLFHEVGHHVTRFLNRRAAPPRKAAQVDKKIERWADEYAEKRLARLVEGWLRAGGPVESPEKRRILAAALRAMRLDDLIRLPVAEETTEGTKQAVPAS